MIGLGAAAQEPDVAAERDRPTSAEPVLESGVRPSLLRRQNQSGESPDEARWIEDNCKFGTPEAVDGAIGDVRIVAREGYVLGHSSLSKVPYWVCEHVERDDLTGPGDREKSSFRPDPRLDGLPRAVPADYSKSGYDQGHMAPAANHKRTQEAMDDTHYLSNIVPQVGLTFNRGIWRSLEAKVREWADDRGECWVISGPMFYDPLEEDPATADGLVPYFMIGDGEVAVPTHCYKIVLAKDGAGEWEAIAFVFENDRHGRPYRLELHRTTVDWIEDRTGLDFFPELRDDDELRNRLEPKKSAMWDEGR